MRKGRGIGIVGISVPTGDTADIFFSSVNIPWPEAGMGDADYLYVFNNVVMPIALEYAPELVFGGMIPKYHSAHSLTPSQFQRVSTPQKGTTSENVMSRPLDMLT